MSFTNKRTEALTWWRALSIEEQSAKCKEHFPRIAEGWVATSSMKVQQMWEKELTA